VNFWRPAGGRRFAAIAPGEQFFFKTHHPHNRIVGGGLYSGFAAWSQPAADGRESVGWVELTRYMDITL